MTPVSAIFLGPRVDRWTATQGTHDLQNYGAIPATFAIFSPAPFAIIDYPISNTQSRPDHAGSDLGTLLLQPFQPFSIPSSVPESTVNDVVSSAFVTPNTPLLSSDAYTRDIDAPMMQASSGHTASATVAEPAPANLAPPIIEMTASSTLAEQAVADMMPILEAAKMTMASLGDVIAALETQITANADNAVAGLGGSAADLLEQTVQATGALQSSVSSLVDDAAGLVAATAGTPGELISTVGAAIPSIPVVTPLVSVTATVIDDLPVIGGNPATGFAILANLLSAADIFSLQESVPAVEDVLASTSLLQLADALAVEPTVSPLLGVIAEADDGVGLLGGGIGGVDLGLGLI